MIESPRQADNTELRNKVAFELAPGVVAAEEEILRDWLADSDFTETGNLGDIQALLMRLSALRR
jgi:hypothetical protein